MHSPVCSTIGLISLNDLRMAMKSLGKNINEKELHNMFSRADRTGCNRIDFDDFVMLLTTSFAAIPNEDLWRVFREFDRSGTNTISREELYSGMKRMGRHSVTSEDLDEIMHAAGVPGGGELNFEQFKKLIV
mmetsp:Transcript_11502/g.17804  ORF Transcript_11502/g.17804 Transcript_11502/m.17804 type:complete len:132 (+) Transcript_11502:45-440(+)